jgi:hypothetical protein
VTNPKHQKEKNCVRVYKELEHTGMYILITSVQNLLLFGLTSDDTHENRCQYINKEENEH